MNFERFNLSSYFDKPKPIDPNENDTIIHKDSLGGGWSGSLRDGFKDNSVKDTISDWGIEETISNSGSGSGSGPYFYNQPPPISSLPSHYSHSHSNSHVPTRLMTVSKDTSTSFKEYYDKEFPFPLAANTENFSKYINHYLRIKLIGEFWEKFKYNLIISNLLDTSMILSKNEQHVQLPTVPGSKFIRQFNNDGLILTILKTYKLKFPDFCPNVIVIINLIIYLLKERGLTKQSRVQFFKVLLIIATRYCKFRRLYMIVQINKILNIENEFLIHNYKLNKRVIGCLVNLKHQQLFGAPNDETMTISENCIDIMNFNLTQSVIKLLPMVNSISFEKYCNINQVDIDLLNPQIPELQDHQDPNHRIELMTSKINKFNNMRKFFICELFSIDEIPETNYFMRNIMDKFKVDIKLENSNNTKRLSVLQEVLVDNNKILDNFNSILEKLTSKVPDHQVTNDTPLNSSSLNKFIEPPSSLNKFIVKINNLSTNLTFFQKYNESSMNDSNEINEKIMIFNQFNEELNNLQQLYKLGLNELMTQSDTNHKTRSGEFSLKSFRTRNSSARGSLIDDRKYEETVEENNRNRYEEDKTFNRYEDKENNEDSYRMGLKLNLLTVFEDSKQFENKQFENSKFENKSEYPSYNQPTLDILSKNQARKASRFSVNSMNSNLSGLSELISSQVTSFDDDNLMTKDELKLKLERNFDKIYNLEKQMTIQGDEC